MLTRHKSPESVVSLGANRLSPKHFFCLRLHSRSQVADVGYWLASAQAQQKQALTCVTDDEVNGWTRPLLRGVLHGLIALLSGTELLQ